VELVSEHWFSFSIVNAPQGADTLDLTLYGLQGVKIGSAQLPLLVNVAAKQYTLTLLRENSTGAALNAAGQAVGFFPTIEGETHAFVWDGSQLLDIGEELGSKSMAYGINKDGVVVGGFGSDCPRSFRFRIGVDAAASALPGECGFTALDVNDSDVTLMWRRSSDTWSAAAYLLSSTETKPVILNPSSPPAGLLELNNRNQILANSANYNAVMLTTTAAPVALNYCAGTDLNESGDVSLFPCKGSGGVILRADGSTVLVPSLGSGSAEVSAINDRGEAAGMYAHALASGTFESRPFFWNGTTSQVIDLGPTDWRITSVVDLNDAGLILAQATNSQTLQHGAVLLRPTE
jgi:probable HAF family extracellular repeat protein